MAYKIVSRFYADTDQFGEAYVIISDNDDPDTKFDIGETVVLEKVVLEKVHKKKFVRKFINSDNYCGGVRSIDDW